MAIVKPFAMQGLKLWFWSHDHEPPHFHAKRGGEWEVKVFFMLEASEMIEIEHWSVKTPPMRVLKKLTANAEKHRVELLAQWQAIRDQEGRQE